MRELSILIVLAFIMAIFMGCLPPQNGVNRPVDRYVKDAKQFVQNVQKEYPDIKIAILNACDAELIAEDGCTKFKEVLDPSIEKSLQVLIDTIEMYERAMEEYRNAVVGSNSETDAWTKVSVALNTIVLELAETTTIYFKIMEIYNDIKE